MHEYSLVRELVDTLTEQVDEGKLERTTAVHLEIGELKVISKEALLQAFEIVTEGTILDRASLEIEDVSLLARCSECDFEGELNYDDEIVNHFSVPVLNCPRCGASVDILKGDEFAVRSLTVSDDDSDE